MDLQQLFAQSQPRAFFVDPEQPEQLQAWLQQQGWIGSERQIRQLGKAGEGNMNLVLRLVLDDGSRFILKQSRPWAEKYPQVPSPAERADTEALYYHQTAQVPALAALSPRLYQADPVSHVLLLEDLGEGTDLSRLYRPGEELDQTTLDALLAYLGALHGQFHRADCDFVIDNHVMRALNAEHIFRYPFVPDNGLDLDGITPGLALAAAECRQDATLMAAIAELEQRYLGAGPRLLHGDFFPGSFLQTAQGVRVIDPEFCFFGDAEFDLGVLWAHLLMAAVAPTTGERLWKAYTPPPGFSRALCGRYAGMEILRRLLGLAQLPLSLDLAAKQALISQARTLLLAPA